ncbi:thermostable hemolysin [Dasania sp. GY-MA-18]|uniref:Thermostable hemolysin n=1 Tax=Dasania phycosphaerae TaxID=2950436 RepID=A0A9J6RLV5_9GAMM|nr:MULTISPECIES: thermostable hemolysin [Dasania]MCR8923005.1 thermostable hemolysin [Dasania sp. GY-MA-18]MCZ0865436.1 thermostable hemolysin [Dasania phycosphaerae]MCZ0869161.1 thermostable hemolysin [Dasania phycosphaerae]
MNTDVTLQYPYCLKRSRQAAVLQRLLKLRPELDLLVQGSDDRLAVETYIEQQFRAVYGAYISEFMPQLLSLRCERQLSAVVGIRVAASHTLFLEQYLAKPIERQLAELLSVTVSRNSVAEIGNLAATHRGSSQLIFLYLTLVLSHSPLQWVVFTATKQVQTIMARCSFDLHIVGAAQPEKLVSNSADWGSYYAGQPNIAAVNIGQALAAIQGNELLANYFQGYQIAIQQCAARLCADELLNQQAGVGVKNANYTDAA